MRWTREDSVCRVLFRLEAIAITGYVCRQNTCNYVESFVRASTTTDIKQGLAGLQKLLD